MMLPVVSSEFERILAHIGVRQIGLAHHFWLARIGNVDGILIPIGPTTDGVN